jgi:hypothetical protein
MPSANTKKRAKAQNLADLKPYSYAVKVRSTTASYASKWVSFPTINNILSREEVNAAFAPFFVAIAETKIKGVVFELLCKDTQNTATFKPAQDSATFHNGVKDAIVKCQFSTDAKEYDASETTCKHAVAIYNRRNGVPVDATTGFRTRYDKADLAHQAKNTKDVKKLMNEVAVVTAKETPLSKLRAALEGKVKALGVSTTAGAVKGKSGK